MREDHHTNTEHDAGRHERARTATFDIALDRPTWGEAEADEQYLRGDQR